MCRTCSGCRAAFHAVTWSRFTTCWSTLSGARRLEHSPLFALRPDANGTQACVADLAVSHFTKGEVEKLFGIDPNKIEVVYNAIDHRFLSGHATDADRQFLAERYQVTYPFLLYADESARTRTWCGSSRPFPR